MRVEIEGGDRWIYRHNRKKWWIERKVEDKAHKPTGGANVS